MKQVLVRKSGITVEDVPAPLVERDHVLVEVGYSLISAGTESSIVHRPAVPIAQRLSDNGERVRNLVEQLRSAGLRRTVQRVRGKLADRLTDPGKPIGYSCAGTVVQVGAGVDGIKPGDQVACAGAGAASHAEVVLVPAPLVTLLPEGCSVRDGSSVAVGAIAMQGVRRAQLSQGEIAVVIGLGLIGQITVQLLRASGCRVLGIDIDARRVELAMSHGAERAWRAGAEEIATRVLHATGGHGADATIITAGGGGSEIAQQAMELTRKKGRVVVVGAVGMDLQRSPFYEKEIDFVISTSYGPGRYDDGYERQGIDYPLAWVRWTEGRNMAEYLRLVATRDVRLEKILEGEFDVGQAPSAYAALQSADRPLGILLRYPEARRTHEHSITMSAKGRADRVRLAVVGAGSFARSTHLPNIEAMRELFCLRTVVARRGDAARAAAERFGAEVASTDFRAAIADPDVDAVLICTRHDAHAAQVIEALRAGKHVFCEKPLALRTEDLDAIEHAAADAGRVLMVGFNRRFAPAARLLRDRLTKRTTPLVATYRVNAGYIPPSHWVHGPEGGGRLVGEGCHMVDLFRALIGRSAVEIAGCAMRPAQDHLGPSDNATFTMRYEDGSIATLVYTSLGHAGAGKEWLEVHADGDTFVLDDWKSLRSCGTASLAWSSPEADKGHREALRAFGEGVRSGQWPIAPAELFEVARCAITLATSN